jgi:radical SAM protein with 4Fe4S-binding SPASM domain
MTAPLSLILLPSLDCNVACDYCFEQKAPISLALSDLPRLTASILDYMSETGAREAEVYWQGGEVLMLGPGWFESAFASMTAAASSRGRQFNHYLQSNLIGYGAHWNDVIRGMFGGAVGTSMDYPNDHRRLKNGSTARYTGVWLEAVVGARKAGLHVSVIAVLHQGSLRAGAEAFLSFFTDTAGIDDLQVNLPFPGGPGEGGDTLDAGALSAFLVDLLDRWASSYRDRGLRLAPFVELINQYVGRPARLPCIWQPNCADEFVTIDARGQVALCDCWVTSYPQYAFGNVFATPSLSLMLGASEARRALRGRPAQLMTVEDCASCEYLALCHGGCPVRTLAAKGVVLAKDPYCEVYKAVFAKSRELAAEFVRQPA